MSHESFDRDALAIAALDAERRREVISAYLDGELSPAAARHVMAWLDTHPDALREVEHLRRVWDLLATYEDEPVPEGFAAGVLARAGLEPGAGRPRLALLGGGRPRLALAAAAVVLVALGIVLWRSRAGEEVTPPSTETASVLEAVPGEMLESVDVLLSLSDEEFQSYLLSDPQDLGG
jgi:anti-sigma factor RsiW